MAFNSKNLAKLIAKSIEDVDEEDHEEIIKATIDKYMKTVKAPAGKGKKAKKDPNAPKRAISAYLFFSNENRKRVKADLDAEGQSSKVGDVAKVLGAEWNALSDKEKKPYQKMAEKDKVRAAKQKAAYESKKKDVESDEGSEDEDEAPKKAVKKPAKKPVAKKPAGKAKGKASTKKPATKKPAKKPATKKPVKKAPPKEESESSDDESSSE